MTIMDIIDKDTSKWDYLKQFVPDLDYHKVYSDMRSPTNFAGHIQRAYTIYWAIKEHERTGGIGLETGAGQVISPFTIATDMYSGPSHPVYGGGYWPHVRCTGEMLPFKNEVFDFIISNHSLEHMKDTERTMREWLRVLKRGGKMAIVMPDKRFGPFGDPSHVSECSPQEFANILQRIENIRILEIDSMRNNFSFDTLLEKT
jgi:SAM-dependent methyltransferase